MSYARGTQNYNLPQTQGTDKRDWSDTNAAFLAIDTAIKTANTTASSASSAASTAQSRADSAYTLASTANTAAGNAATAAATADEKAVTAKNRADSAYTLASGKQGKPSVSNIVLNNTAINGTSVNYSVSNISNYDILTFVLKNGQGNAARSTVITLPRIILDTFTDNIYLPIGAGTLGGGLILAVKKVSNTSLAIYSNAPSSSEPTVAAYKYLDIYGY